MEARVGIGEAWPVLPPGNLSERMQACLSRLKPTQARNGLEVRVRVRVWVRSLLNCSSNPIATGEAKWTPPSPEFPSCAQLDCRGNGREGVGPGWAGLRNGDGAQSSATLWLGRRSSDERPPAKLDASIIFAPVGALVPAALSALTKGGTVVCGGNHAIQGKPSKSETSSSKVNPTPKATSSEPIRVEHFCSKVRDLRPSGDKIGLFAMDAGKPLLANTSARKGY